MANMLRFSAEEVKSVDLALDLVRNEFSSEIEGSNLTKKDLEEELRNRIKNDILKGKSLWRTFRDNKSVAYAIIEEIINVGVGEDVLNSEFVNRFVEVKNRALGDASKWYIENESLFVVSKFAGNHWDTPRQLIEAGQEFTLPSEWFVVHIYDEFERFLLGLSDITRLTDRLYRSVNKFVQDRIQAQFASLVTSVPSQLSATGNTEEQFGKLVDVIMAASGMDNVIIAGTRGALRKLSNVVPEKIFAESQKEAISQTGKMTYWEGHPLMMIPQTVKPGTLELALDDTKLYILAGNGDFRPIKVEFFGDTRTREISDYKMLNDMTWDFQVQTKMGIGLAVGSNAFGVFTFA